MSEAITLTETRDRRPALSERALNAAPIALLEFDARGVIVQVNPAAERLLRRPAAAIVGRCYDDPVWGVASFEGAPIEPSDLPVARALRGEEIDATTVLIAAPDGERLYLSCRAAPLRNEERRIGGVIVALTDLSEARRAREELAQSRARMAYALEAAKMIVWEWEPASGHFVYNLDAERSVDSAAQGRVIPRGEFHAMVHPDDRARVRETFDAAFKSGEEYVCEYRLITKPNDEVWVVSRGRVVTSPDGVRRMSGVIADISARKKEEFARAAVQEALAHSEERFRLALDGTGAGVYDLELGAGEAVWTPAVFEMLGLPYAPGGRASLAMFRNALHPDDAEAVSAAHARAEASLGPLAIEYRIRHARTREERWLSAYGRVYQRDGARRAIGIVFDITDRKRAEERERLLMREVDHRAKNVLAVVRSVLQLTPHQDIETFIASVTGRISAIARVHTLLADSRWTSASVTALIEAELAAYRQAGQIDVSGPDAAAAPDAAQAIAMILHELATNAAKYGALSTPYGRLSITLGRSGDDLRIDWIEHGPHPIEAPPAPGFGSRMIATLAQQQLNGSVVYDWRASGLVVHLALPGLGAVECLRREAASEEFDRPCRDLRNRAILVVEDDTLVSMALEQALADAGGRVRAFRTVDDALTSVRKAPPELAVLDVNVRGIPVTPVAAELARRGVPFVYATGYSDNLAELPPGAIIRKPYGPDEICAVLQRLAGAS